MKQEFTQEIKNYLKDYLQDVHTVLPGEIVSFDAGKCEATVKPIAKYWKPDKTKIDFPIRSEVPVFFPQGIAQGATIVYPVRPGDECLIFFAEQALDQWRTGAESETDLRFDITNAIALVGFFSAPNPHVARSDANESIIIQRANTFVELFDAKIEIKTDGDIYVEAAKKIDVESGTDTIVRIKGNAIVNVTGRTEIGSIGPLSVTAPIVSIN